MRETTDHPHTPGPPADTDAVIEPDQPSVTPGADPAAFVAQQAETTPPSDAADARSAAGDVAGDTDNTADEGSREPAEEQAPLAETIARLVAEEMAPTLTELATVHSRLQDRIAAYEETTRTLHSRLESLQQDQVRALLKPAFERLAALHAEATRSAADKADSDPTGAADFTFFADSVEEMLSLYDLVSVEAASDQPFDSKMHHAQRATPTSDESANGKIQRVVRQGFTFAGAPRAFLPARVSVYTHVPTTEPASQAAPTESAETPDLAEPTEAADTADLTTSAGHE